MKVTLYLTTGRVDVASMPDDDGLTLLEEFEADDGAPTLRLTLDDAATTLIARRHVVRIDVDES